MGEQMFSLALSLQTRTPWAGSELQPCGETGPMGKTQTRATMHASLGTETPRRRRSRGPARIQAVPLSARWGLAWALCKHLLNGCVTNQVMTGAHGREGQSIWVSGAWAPGPALQCGPV